MCSVRSGLVQKDKMVSLYAGPDGDRNKKKVEAQTGLMVLRFGRFSRLVRLVFSFGSIDLLSISFIITATLSDMSCLKILKKSEDRGSINISRNQIST